MHVVGTAMLANLVPLLAGLLPCAVHRALFPARVLANLIILVSVSMLAVAFQLWAGGVFCDPSMRGRGTAPSDAANDTINTVCNGNGDPDLVAFRFGAPQYIGLGLLAFLMILVVEIFACPLLRDGAVLISLLVAWLVAFLSPQWNSSAGKGAFYPGMDPSAYLTRCPCCAELGCVTNHGAMLACRKHN